MPNGCPESRLTISLIACIEISTCNLAVYRLAQGYGDLLMVIGERLDIFVFNEYFEVLERGH